MRGGGCFESPVFSGEDDENTLRVVRESYLETKEIIYQILKLQYINKGGLRGTLTVGA